MFQRMKPYEEVHVDGLLELSLDDVDTSSRMCDLGIQISEDGRVWICIDGETILRFKAMKIPDFDKVKRCL